MSLGSALHIATSGLTAANARALAAADNVANASTPGYVRRTAVLSEHRVGGQGDGVRVLGLERAPGGAVTAERMRADAGAATAAGRQRSARALDAALGAPTDPASVMSAYARFETSLRDAAATPENTALLDRLAQDAGALTRRLGAADAGAAGLRADADAGIAATVEEVNGALVRLEALNRLPGEQVTPAVLDERDRLVGRINEALPVRALPKGDAIHLVTEGGAFLLTETARQVAFAPAGLVGREDALGAPLSGLSVDGVDLTPTGDGPQRSRGGRLATLFEARDETAPRLQDRLDGLAEDLVARFADDAVDPSKPAGQAGLFTDAGAAAAGGFAPGLAGRLAVNAAVDPAQGGQLRRLRDGLGAPPGAAGNGEQLNRLLGAFTAGQGASGGVAELSSDQGAASRRASDDALTAGARRDAARDAELSARGVDTDAELQSLLRIEQAYAANARVLQTVGDMLDTLMRAFR